MSTTTTAITDDPRLAKFVATRDRAFAKSQPWSPTPLAERLTELAAKGSVKVGGRSTCGSSSDPTWKVFTAWNEVVRKARKLGYAIEEEAIKQKNKSPTTCGGYWHESEYRLTA